MPDYIVSFRPAQTLYERVIGFLDNIFDVGLTFKTSTGSYLIAKVEPPYFEKGLREKIMERITDGKISRFAYNPAEAQRAREEEMQKRAEDLGKRKEKVKLRR